MSRCQREPWYRKTADSAPPPYPRIRQASCRASGPGRYTGQRTRRRAVQPRTTPIAYPVADSTPLTMPWTYQGRGSRDGVSDRQKKAMPRAVPAKSSPGRGARSTHRWPTDGVPAGGALTGAPLVAVIRDQSTAGAGRRAARARVTRAVRSTAARRSRGTG